MTRDDVLRMAREAGMVVVDDKYSLFPFLERFAALVAAAERERAAQICDAEASIEGIAQRCAAAIRGMK